MASSATEFRIHRQGKKASTRWRPPGGGQTGETQGEKKHRVVDKITRLFDRFSTLSN